MGDGENLYIEVRCCCDGHLMGWAPLGGRIVGSVTYKIPDLSGVGTVYDTTKLIPPKCETHEIVLYAERYGSFIDDYYCYKSRDYAIEDLHKIRGFVEYKAGQTYPPGRVVRSRSFPDGR